MITRGPGPFLGIHDLRAAKHSLYDQLRWMWREVHRRDDEASLPEIKQTSKSFSQLCFLVKIFESSKP
ncbi:hypothetical protein Y032_0267g744 [Ancylostoma ceylanicum]|uniref:Uncharacterized protein n=1 Tax=Ancylostoma ceylanicum TaxID=53326 RepID=A0A016SA52_9BILA|nr:hypothetical protein Y032_0267g744 [Ancylostoma ceylanicum]